MCCFLVDEEVVDDYLDYVKEPIDIEKKHSCV